MLIKAVYTVVSGLAQQMYSLTDNAFRIFYRPAEWIHPALIGSGLFCYTDIASALRTAILNKFSLPYFGQTLWYCEAKGSRVPRQFIRNPPETQIVYYWKQERINMEGLMFIRWPYKLKPEETIGWCVADSIRLTEPVDMKGLTI